MRCRAITRDMRGGLKFKARIYEVKFSLCCTFRKTHFPNPEERKGAKKLHDNCTKATEMYAEKNRRITNDIAREIEVSG